MRRAFLIATLILAGCQQRSANPSPGPPGNATSPGGPSIPPKLSLTIVDPSGATGPFPIDDLEYLTLQATYSNAQPGTYALRLDVVDPRGALFAQFLATLQATQSGDASASSVIRVRGTPIAILHQVGTWQVAANVDGAPLASASVDLTE